MAREGVERATACHVALLALVAGLAWSLTSCLPASPRTGDVTLYGDSLSVQSNIPISNAITGAGLTFVSHSFGGLALCDALGEMRTDAASTTRPKVVVVAYIGNNRFPCMQHADGTPLTGADLRNKYYADLATVHNIWAPLSVPVVLLGAPATATDDHVAFDQMLQQAASDFGFTYEDVTPDLSPGNVFASSLPCESYESVAQGTCTGPVIDGVQDNIVRSSDGVHLCPDVTGVHSSVTPDCAVYASGELTPRTTTGSTWWCPGVTWWCPAVRWWAGPTCPSGSRSAGRCRSRRRRGGDGRCTSRLRRDTPSRRAA